jgi:hypothetical protein
MTRRDNPLRQCAPRNLLKQCAPRSPVRAIRQRVLLVAAFAALVCFLAAGGLWHHDDPSAAAACPICQVAHMPVTGPVAQPSLIVVRTVVARAPQAEANLYAAPGLFPSSSRAPPTA